MPGQPEKSLLIKAIRYTDAELRMPKKAKLSAEVIADFEKWVAMGAPDPRTGTVKIAGHKYPTVEEGRNFWAFKPMNTPTMPTVKDSAWPRGDIDRLLLGKMEEKNLRPSRDADRATLLRRLYFALIGMPPSPLEIDAFLNDRSPQAVEHVVDRLLASPHFGERWGRHWLDVARFAESSGGGRTQLFKDAWRYRDYVINAFNTDKPFTQVIVEQLSGDLLGAKSPEERYWQLVATAFLLLGPTNFEGQDKPQLEMDVNDEQSDTMGKAFLGMTIGCARCHDHKFDPIPTKDYYALAGIFKSTKFIVHSNVSKWMERPLPSMDPGLDARIVKHDAAVAELKKQIAAIKAKNPKAGIVTEIVKGTPLDAKELPGIVIDDTQAPQGRAPGSTRPSRATTSAPGHSLRRSRHEGGEDADLPAGVHGERRIRRSPGLSAARHPSRQYAGSASSIAKGTTRSTSTRSSSRRSMAASSRWGGIASPRATSGSS